MKPFFETIIPHLETSWAFLDRQLPHGIPFEWHYHPEYELTLTLNSAGHRYIGEAVDPYDDGDLALIGPNLLHSWASEGSPLSPGSHRALVCHFTLDWVKSLISLFPEFGKLHNLLAHAGQGIEFGTSIRHGARNLMMQMQDASPAHRLALMLDLLALLSQSEEWRPILPESTAPVLSLEQDKRLGRVLAHLHSTYREPIRMETLAGLACMSVSALQRLFKCHMRSTISCYLIRLRIGYACTRLIGGVTSITTVAGEAGYSNLALFNRHFRRLHGETPSAFRKRHSTLFF